MFSGFACSQSFVAGVSGGTTRQTESYNNVKQITHRTGLSHEKQCHYYQWKAKWPRPETMIELFPLLGSWT